MKTKKGFKTVFIAIMAAAIMILQPLFVTKAHAMENTYYDTQYYNTGILTDKEWDTLVDLPKGTVIVMSSINNTFYYGKEAEEMVIDGSVTVVSMPGVGSSSIGTAAFAKHIAIARNEYIAGIVTGLGVASVGSEGIQGYYIGRPFNMSGQYYYEPASDKLAELYDAGARPKLLIGHSKGNMDLVNALYKMWWENKQDQYKGVDIITFGCGVYVPPKIGSIRQYLGNIDSLGILNTVSYYNLVYVIGATHSTNPKVLTYMPIERYVVK
jgi:hypothetical protein